MSARVAVPFKTHKTEKSLSDRIDSGVIEVELDGRKTFHIGRLLNSEEGRAEFWSKVGTKSIIAKK